MGITINSTCKSLRTGNNELVLVAITITLYRIPEYSGYLFSWHTLYFWLCVTYWPLLPNWKSHEFKDIAVYLKADVQEIVPCLTHWMKSHLPATWNHETSKPEGRESEWDAGTQVKRRQTTLGLVSRHHYMTSCARFYFPPFLFTCYLTLKGHGFLWA